jgi:glycosyltransferase involved in cell wall biosynthesis
VTKVLFHSYHYPPIGGSGAQRPLKMSRYLPGTGYDPIVITGDGPTGDRWTPEDETLVGEIPSDVVVRRVPVVSGRTVDSRWRGRAQRWLGRMPAWEQRWVEESIRVGVEYGSASDLVYAWMQPYASAAAGLALSRILGKPWVADLGDPWALDEMIVYPTRLHRAWQRRRMAEVLSTAAAIVMSTDEAVRRLRSIPAFAAKRVVAIPNGFDASDFDGPDPARRPNCFRIVQTGYLHTELGREHRRLLPLRRLLGGSVSGVEILTRSHVYVIEAINRLLERDNSLAEILRLELAGVLTNADREVAARCPVALLHGYVNHAESVRLIRSANLLFLPMHNLPPGSRATIVPGKTYEYLASGTPILAAVPDGDARDILERAANARLCRPDDVDCMTAAIADAIRDYRAGRPAPKPNAEVVQQFEYRQLAGRLAAVFDAVLDAPTGLKS